ncbi:MAG: DUF4416 family protein [candidate division WOR-3 bacterium]|nr:DUF4416 family protein [candidate division WOR-3 bacterium]MCX7837440.1 DUF4416 family protein [candidate division WOR-3 bacterium]
MGEIKPPQKVKVVVGYITNDVNLINKVNENLSFLLGPVDLTSDIIDFNFTDYYEKEMGKELKRQWVSFKNLMMPDFLAELKIKTNEIEDSFKEEGKRRINIDPGILTLNNFILATTKNYAHRIYLREGIYAEVTLIYQNKKFNNLTWTYPDYQTDFFHNFLLKVRKVYIEDLRKICYSKEEDEDEIY